MKERDSVATMTLKEIGTDNPAPLAAFSSWSCQGLLEIELHDKKFRFIDFLGS